MNTRRSVDPAKQYQGVGFFEHQWRHPPPPFNPLFDPKAKARYAEVSRSMEDDGFYEANDREACRIEWRRRYDLLEARDKAGAVT